MHFCAFLYAYLKRFPTRHADVSTGSLNLKPKPFLQFERLLNYLQVLEVHNTAKQRQKSCPVLHNTAIMQHPHSLQ